MTALPVTLLLATLILWATADQRPDIRRFHASLSIAAMGKFPFFTGSADKNSHCGTSVYSLHDKGNQFREVMAATSKSTVIKVLWPFDNREACHILNDKMLMSPDMFRFDLPRDAKQLSSASCPVSAVCPTDTCSVWSGTAGGEPDTWYFCSSGIPVFRNLTLWMDGVKTFFTYTFTDYSKRPNRIEFIAPEDNECTDFRTPRTAAVGTASDIPASFDAREKWPLCHTMRIRDQKYGAGCSACWAFAAAETLADRLCIATNASVNSDLSPQWMISCYTNMFGCGGGYSALAWDNLRANGIATEECYPFANANAKCPSACADGSKPVLYHSAKTVTVFRGTNWSATSEAIQREVMTSGPVEASIAMLVANSFGTRWGESGTIRIARGVNELGLVGLLARRLGDAEATERVLCDLARVPKKLRVALARAGAPAAILAALEAHPHSPAVAAAALRAMARACAVVPTSGPKRVADLQRCARAAADAMSRHAASAPVQAAGCEALAHLAGTRGDVLGACLAGGAPARVLGALARFPDAARVAAGACGAVGALCASEAAREALERAGAVVGLARALREGLRREGGAGVVEACSALARVCAGCEAARVVGAGVVEDLALLLRSSPRAAHLLPAVVAVLCDVAVSGGPPGRERVLGSGAFGDMLLAASAVQHQLSYRMASSLCRAVAAVAAAPEGQLVVDSSQGADVLLSVLASYPTHPVVAEEALRALWTLASTDDSGGGPAAAIRAKLQHPRAHQAIERVARTQPGNVRVVRIAGLCTACLARAEPEDVQQCLAAGACTSLRVAGCSGSCPTLDGVLCVDCCRPQRWALCFTCDGPSASKSYCLSCLRGHHAGHQVGPIMFSPAYCGRCSSGFKRPMVFRSAPSNAERGSITPIAEDMQTGQVPEHVDPPEEDARHDLSALREQLREAEQRSEELESAHKKLQEVAREIADAKEEIDKLKAELEECKDAPQNLVKLQEAYDALLYAYYS
eukprot:m51a1_g5777 putative protein (983) ;mRNA; f:1253513-1257388